MANNVSLYRGDAFSFDATLILDDAPVDLNDYICFFTAKKRKTDPDSKAVARKNSNSPPDVSSGGITILSAAGGQVRVVLLHDDTKNLLEGTYYYGVNIVNKTDPALVYTLLEGRMTVNLDIGARITEDPT